MRTERIKSGTRLCHRIVEWEEERMRRFSIHDEGTGTTRGDFLEISVGRRTNAVEESFAFVALSV